MISNEWNIQLDWYAVTNIRTKIPMFIMSVYSVPFIPPLFFNVYSCISDFFVMWNIIEPCFRTACPSYNVL